jgi:hypothetical protein
MSIVRQEINIEYVYLQYGFQWMRRAFHVAVTEMKYIKKVKVRQSRYRPGVAQRVPGSEGKAVPLQAWSGPEGSRKLRFPDFTTTVQDGGNVVSLTHRPPLPPGNTPGTRFC